MRRQARASTGEPVVKAGPLAIDLAARVVMLNGSRVILTPKEYKLLQILAQHAGNVVTHQYLLKEVWGSPHVHDTHYLRIFVRKLRQKIEDDPTQPRILLTELGIGYRLGRRAVFTLYVTGLLNYMRQFVRQQFFARFAVGLVFAFVENNIGSAGIGLGIDGLGRFGCFIACMHPYVRKVLSKPVFHKMFRAFVEH